MTTTDQVERWVNRYVDEFGELPSIPETVINTGCSPHPATKAIERVSYKRNLPKVKPGQAKRRRIFR